MSSPLPASRRCSACCARAVTVGKGEQAIKDIPQSISVITRQRMDDQNLNTVDDVLASTTGITMYDSPMGGRYVYSRGFRVDTSPRTTSTRSSVAALLVKLSACG